MSPELNKLKAVCALGIKQLGWDDETKAATLLREVGKSRLREMTKAELKRTLEYIKRCGFKVRSKAPEPVPYDPQVGKLRAVWAELHAAGAVRDASDAALTAYVKRYTRCERMEWATAAQIGRVIEQAKKWLDRVRGG